MTFKEWMETVPETIRGDPVWNVQAYRLALFAGELAWKDATKLLSDKRTISLADQLNPSSELAGQRPETSQPRATPWGRVSKMASPERATQATVTVTLCATLSGLGRLGARNPGRCHGLRCPAPSGLQFSITQNERGFSIREEAPAYEAWPLHLLDSPPLPAD